MALKLISLQFRGLDPSTSQALPLRPDPDKHPFDVPEWSPGAGDVFVAWRLDRTTTSGATVEVGLRSDVSGEFQIKADDPTGANLSGFIQEFTVELRANVPAVVTAQLVAPLLEDPAQAKVTFRTDTWNWRWRAAGGNWSEPFTTSHRSYVVLGRPSEPWSDTDPEKYVWTEALEFSCEWAEGATSADEAATNITRAFFALGSPAVRKLSYQGGSNYTYGAGVEPSFGCIDLIHYLKTGYPAEPFVDCHDVACAVSTFGNALGAALIQGRVGLDFGQFQTNPAATVGGQPAPPRFNEHEMAWGGRAEDFDPVWDACLQVDSDPDPEKPPHPLALLPGAAYTGAGTKGYRDRLAIQKHAKKMRAPGPRTPCDNRVLRSAYPLPRFTPLGPQPATVPSNLHDFLATVPLGDWRMVEWYQDAISSEEVIYRSAVIPADGPSGPLARVEWRRCPSVQRARDVFREYRALFSGPIEPIEGLGDAAFGLVSRDSVVFLWWNAVVRVSRSSFDPGPLAVLPGTIDRALTAAFHNTLI